MLLGHLKTGLLLTALAVLLGCSEPPVPPEIHQALSQEQDLWRAGASVYAPAEYRLYLAALEAGRDQFSREQGRLIVLRDYQPVIENFRRVLTLGEQVRTLTQAGQENESGEISRRLKAVEKQVQNLRDLAARIHDRRLTSRRLAQAEILIDEAAARVRGGNGQEALTKIDRAEAEVAAAVKAIKPLISRYADRQQITRWQQMVNNAVATSKRSGRIAIVVNKLDRTLTVYRGGIPIRTYPAGLGFNFLSDKLYSGDRATPEGNYQVTGKLPASAFYRALLINYPNEEDRRRFSQAKKSGQLPASARIGGLIEIHGGGKAGMTNGCVALENKDILELFGWAELGTPVVIVGAVKVENIVTSFLQKSR